MNPLSPLLAVLMLPAASAASEASMALVPVCDVAEHPERYVGAMITMQAEYLTDGRHYSLLGDRTCRGRKAIALGPELAEGATARLRDYNLGPLPIGPRPPVRLKAVFSGKIVRVGPSEYEVPGDHGYRFSVQTMDDIHTEPRTEQP